jgi:hypothetical protein
MRGQGSNRDLTESFLEFLVAVARFLLWVGLLAIAGTLGLLIYTAVAYTTGTPAPEAQAIANIEIFRKALVIGLIAFGVGSTYLLWGEETLGPLQLVFAGALYFAPLYLPSVIGGEGLAVAGAAYGAMQTGGLVFASIAICVLVADVAVRFRLRAQEGFKAEQLKYGKNIKEEKDRQNVFMGKCWQLPFCRKFVRERCPIYHSKRTCWKERVGCMCEEQVIRNAMENRVIPKDEVAAAAFIPVNNKLTLDQKRERCNQCVIYNEHQKHKYRLLLPVMVVGFGLIYFLGRPFMLSASEGVLLKLDRVVGVATLRPEAGIATAVNTTLVPMHEILLACVMLILFAYCMKGLEFLVFRLKI